MPGVPVQEQKNLSAGVKKQTVRVCCNF